MQILIDTNLLVRLADSASDLHRTASDAVRLLAAQENQLVVVPQNIYEFWSVATRTIAANGLGYSPNPSRGIPF